MNEGKAIVAILAADAPTVAVLGADKVFPMSATQQSATPPYAVYSVVNVTPSETKDGYSLIDNTLFQIDVYSKTYAEAITAARAIRLALETHTGGIAGIEIDNIRLSTHANTYNSEVQYFQISSDYRARINNPVT